MSSSSDDIRVIVGLDFGTTYSGFTFCHIKDSILHTNQDWPGELGEYKTNTVLQYDQNFEKVELWGHPALFKHPNSNRGSTDERKHVVELFKLHLGNLQSSLKEELPLDYKKAIVDYLREIGKWIKDAITAEWDGIDLLQNVLLVLTVPAEYSEGAKAIMRECAFNAGLIGNKISERLQFTTEPEAVAIYCMDKKLREHDLTASGTNFMIVDCGGGTVDLTTRKLLDDHQLGEITERAGDYCGSAFIDKEFIKELRKILGEDAMNKLRDNHYGHYQHIVQEFCNGAKIPFTGDDENINYELDLEDHRPTLLRYVSDEVKEKMENDEWMITFDYKTIKSMFDPIIERILRMIHAQLENTREKCSIMFLAGGFSQSKYLQKRIRQKFRDQVDRISVPTDPIAAISRGAAIYGLNFNDMNNNVDGIKHIIRSRVLKFTYGIKVGLPIIPGVISVLTFHCIAKRGTEVKVDEEFIVDELRPSHTSQKKGRFEIYYTREYDGTFCDDPGMKLLGVLNMDLPDVDLGLKRPITFKLTFGRMEITAIAVNDTNGQNYQASFEINAENEENEENKENEVNEENKENED